MVYFRCVKIYLCFDIFLVIVGSFNGVSTAKIPPLNQHVVRSIDFRKGFQPRKSLIDVGSGGVRVAINVNAPIYVMFGHNEEPIEKDQPLNIDLDLDGEVEKEDEFEDMETEGDDVLDSDKMKDNQKRRKTEANQVEELRKQVKHIEKLLRTYESDLGHMKKGHEKDHTVDEKENMKDGGNKNSFDKSIDNHKKEPHENMKKRIDSLSRKDNEVFDPWSVCDSASSNYNVDGCTIYKFKKNVGLIGNSSAQRPREIIRHSGGEAETLVTPDNFTAVVSVQYVQLEQADDENTKNGSIMFDTDSNFPGFLTMVRGNKSNEDDQEILTKKQPINFKFWGNLRLVNDAFRGLICQQNDSSNVASFIVGHQVIANNCALICNGLDVEPSYFETVAKSSGREVTFFNKNILAVGCLKLGNFEYGRDYKEDNKNWTVQGIAKFSGTLFHVNECTLHCHLVDN